ncbi:MAG: hypothetical protein ACM3Y9_12755 [Ignavibacteria bacterium]
MENWGKWIWIVLVVVALAVAAFAKSVLFILLGIVIAIVGAVMSRR